MKAAARRTMETFLRPLGYHLVPEPLIYDWQRSDMANEAVAATDVLPVGAREYLRPGNPRLKELTEAYAALNSPVTNAAVWTTGYVRDEDLLYFRGDNPYVYQRRGRNMNEMSYALTYYYTRANDHLGLLSRLQEDRSFGAYTVDVEDRKTISRDLLDSVSELNFLDRHLGIAGKSGAVVLDIGAGYGRLAHRTVTGLGNVSNYLCTDAIAVSTFLCEYHLRHRELGERARAIPLHEIEARLKDQRVDVAVNIHSFSECTLQAIAWWANLLRQNRVPYLMVVPNRVSADGRTVLTNAGEDFSKVLAEHGYSATVCESKYQDAMVRKYGANPATQFLFALS